MKRDFENLKQMQLRVYSSNIFLYLSIFKAELAISFTKFFECHTTILFLQLAQVYWRIFRKQQ